MIDSPLLLYICAILTPLAMAAGLTEDLALAAAREAIGAHKGPLMSAAKITALGMAMLDNLRLSAAPEMSVSLKLKLRGNAAALNRAERATTAEEARQPPPEPAGRPLPDDDTIREAAGKLVSEVSGSDPGLSRPPAVATEPPAQDPKPAKNAVPQGPATPQPATAAPGSGPGPVRQPVSVNPAAPGLAAPWLAVPSGQAKPATAAELKPANPAQNQSGDPYANMWADAMATVAAEMTEGLDKLGPEARAAEMMRLSLLQQTVNGIRRK